MPLRAIKSHNPAGLPFALIILALLCSCNNSERRPPIPEVQWRDVLLDDQGVIRWSDNLEEVALFGANYCLPSASDYRAMGYLTEERKSQIERDMAHFARMGWDGLRICLWGDWENSDSAGNLVVNDHLDLMDYLIFKARERGIYILFTPITTYSSLWPDAQNDTTAKGFSAYFMKEKLGTDPAAIRAQVNYLRQILEHVNPYTGTTIKDDPSIIMIEMINEPSHHPENFKVSVNYINTLVEAVRSTGCNKLLFHNFTQDSRMGKALKASEIQGVTFAWYPSGLVSGRLQQGNFLRTVDDFPPMLDKEISGMPRIVYEFDSPDMFNGYLYPAMTRTFRSAGAQFAAMFSYDMHLTAPYNLGWQTHFLNMVYTPGKAVSAIISSEVIRIIPRYSEYGEYPDNTSFGPFRVSYEENLAEMLTDEVFMYSNDTRSKPFKPESLNKIVGYGSSPVVNYEGKGIYFLDRIKEGTWRLEVYPDAMNIRDPFSQPRPDRVVTRLICRNWPMKIDLPGLGGSFSVHALRPGSGEAGRASSGVFEVSPGIYILDNSDQFSISDLPETISRVGMREFVCNPPEDLPLDVNILAKQEYLEGRPMNFTAEVIHQEDPEKVLLFLNRAGARRSRSHPMEHIKGYTYSVTLPAESATAGFIQYAVAVRNRGEWTTFPGGVKGSPALWPYVRDNFLRAGIVPDDFPLSLFHPQRDLEWVSFTRIGDNIRWGIFQLKQAPEIGQGSIYIQFPSRFDRNLDDYTFSLPVLDRISARGKSTNNARALTVQARGENAGCNFLVTLVETDGTSWSQRFNPTEAWKEIRLPIDGFKISQGVKLPQGFPERWNYWIPPAEGRGGPNDVPNLEELERLQVSMRPERGTRADGNAWFEICEIKLVFSEK